jgi:hypothetical protein
MKTDTYSAKIKIADEPVKLRFHNGPLLQVSISRGEPFFREVEKRWNQCHVERDDPHRPLQELTQVGSRFSESAKEQFVRKFLLLAAVATRRLDEGQESACASLEHHANQI